MASSSPLTFLGTTTRLLLLVLVLTALATKVSAADDNDQDNNNAAVAAFIPTQDNFAASSDSAALAEEESEMMHGSPPLKLSFWTTPHHDWDSTLLLRIKPLIVRFQKHMIAFHPHQGIIDGALIGCHDPKGGPTDISKLSEACLDNCVNAGRYCAVFFPNHVDKTHAGLIGADLVMESSRRLCIWIQYGNKQEESYKYFDYIQQIRETSCDLSLSDNCIDRVYREVGIEEKKIADCMHEAGGVGSQVDTKNAILLGEGHRGANMNLTYDELPHMAINGEAIENVTALSDWQIMAEVCTSVGSGSGGPPKLCEFCLWECPKGNNNHDPTQQCLWDLTCGDDRTFDDWMKGSGPYANPSGGAAGGGATNSTNNSTDANVDDNNKEEEGAEDNEQKEEESAETDLPTSAPTAAPTDGENADTKPDPHKDEDLDEDEIGEDLGGNNSTNTTSLDEEEEKELLPEDNNNSDTNSSLPSSDVEPTHPNPADHHNTSSSSHHHPKDDKTTTTTPSPTASPKTKSPAPTPAPHHSKPSYNSPIAPLKPTTHHHDAPTTTSGHGGKGNAGAGNNNVPPQPPIAKKKSPNTTNPAEAVEGLAIAVVCLAVVVVGVYMIQRYRTGKDVYATVDHRDVNGLASTASHAADRDLELHVEISSCGLGRGSRSDGYAPPSKGTWG